MRIGSSRLKSNHKFVAVPEQSLNAARSLEMLNSTRQPFLPGKVALYQDGAFLGVTEIDFIAQGEKFAVFLSVADHIKLSRRLDRKHSALVRGKRNKMQVGFIVTVENLSSEATTLRLADRIPVSENRAIRVDRVKISGGGKPNRQGLVSWDLELAPGERREFRISYQVEYPALLVLEAKRRLEATPAKARAAGRRSIDEQLLYLEQQI